MEKSEEQLSIFCQILIVIAILDFVGGVIILFTFSYSYASIMGFAVGVGSALSLYAITQIITLLANIKRNTGKTQEYLELLTKSLSKK